MLFRDRLPDPARPFAVIADEPIAGTALSRQFIDLVNKLHVPQSP